MQPFTVLLGVVLGSCFSMAFSLAVVSFVFWMLRDYHPQFSVELPELARAAEIFALLALASVLAFYGNLRRAGWRFVPQMLLFLGLAATGYYYWPD